MSLQGVRHRPHVITQRLLFWVSLIGCASVTFWAWETFGRSRCCAVAYQTFSSRSIMSVFNENVITSRIQIVIANAMHSKNEHGVAQHVTSPFAQYRHLNSRSWCWASVVTPLELQQGSPHAWHVTSAVLRSWHWSGFAPSPQNVQWQKSRMRNHLTSAPAGTIPSIHWNMLKALYCNPRYDSWDYSTSTHFSVFRALYCNMEHLESDIVDWKCLYDA